MLIIEGTTPISTLQLSAVKTTSVDSPATASTVQDPSASSITETKDQRDFNVQLSTDVNSVAYSLLKFGSSSFEDVTLLDQISTYRSLLRFLYSCLLVSCFVYEGFLHWSFVSILYSSCYWHLLDPYFLRFHPATLIGLCLAYLLIPLILRIPKIRSFLSTPKGRFAESLVSCLLVGAGLQIHSMVRTMFFAVVMGLSANRLSIPSNISNYESLALSGGLFLLLCLRSLGWSMHPVDLVNYWFIPAALLFVWIVCSFTIAFEEDRFGNLEKKLIATGKHDLAVGGLQSTLVSSPDYHLSVSLLDHWSVPRGSQLRFLYGLSSTILLSTTTFLIATVLTSDAVIPRWSSLDPVSYGFVVTGILGLGWLLYVFVTGSSTYNRLFVPKNAKVNPSRMMILLSTIIFAIGGVLLIACRTTSGTATFVGGCLFTFSVPFILNYAIKTYKNVNATATPRCGCLMTLLFGLWMVGGFFASVAWYAGTLVPVLGSWFFDNILAVWLGSFVPALVSLFILQSMCWAYTNILLKQKKIPLPDEDTDNLKEHPTQLFPNPVSQIKPKRPFFPAVLVVYVLMMSCLFLPSLRLRIYYYSQRGSRLVLPLFTAATFNIQAGYSLPSRLYSGFPLSQRIVDLDSKLTPHFWGIVESASTNLLHMNRDWTSYLASSMYFHVNHGPPPWTATPGVALLTTEKLVNATYRTLPKGNEPLRRVVSWGIYQWRDSPGAPLLATLIVAVAHLSAFSEEARKTQLAAISKLIETDWAMHPVILVGDINCTPMNSTIIWDNKNETLPRGKLRLANPDSSPTELVSNTNIDHIYYQGLCLKDHGVLNTFGISDHLPVWAKFSLPTRNGTELCN